MRTVANVVYVGILASTVFLGCGIKEVPEPTTADILSDISKAVQTSCKNDRLVIDRKSKTSGLLGGGEILYWVTLMQEGKESPHYTGYVKYVAKKGPYMAVEFSLGRGKDYRDGVIDVYKKDR